MEKIRHVSWQREWAIWFNRMNYQSHDKMNALGNGVVVFISPRFPHLAHAFTFHAECASESFAKNQWIVLNGPERSMRPTINIYSIEFARAVCAFFSFLLHPFGWRFLFEWIWFGRALCVHSSPFYWNVRDFSLFAIHIKRGNRIKTPWGLGNAQKECKSGVYTHFARCCHCCWCDGPLRIGHGAVRVQI